MRQLILAGAFALGCLATGGVSAGPTLAVATFCPPHTTFFKLNPIGMGYPTSNWGTGVQCCHVTDNSDPHHPQLSCQAKVPISRILSPGATGIVAPIVCPPGKHMANGSCVK